MYQPVWLSTPAASTAQSAALARWSSASGTAIVAKITIESGWMSPARGQGVGVITLMLLVLLSYGGLNQDLYEVDLARALDAVRTAAKSL